MQVRSAKTVLDQKSARVLCLLLPIVMLLLNACAVERPFRFHPSSVTRISYDPSNCTQMQDGKFKCKEVIFTVAAVEAAPPK